MTRDGAELQEILDAVAVEIRAVIAEDWIEGTPIGMETSFVDDLEIESVEMVALSERLQERFGDGLDLAGWLGGRPMDELLSLTVGDLVRHVAAVRA